MHVQSTVPQWTEALLKLPDRHILLSVASTGPLVDGISKWKAAGRDPNLLISLYRHYDLYFKHGDPATLRAHWREMFFRFINRTWLETPELLHLKGVLELNEYFNDTSWAGPERQGYIDSVTAALQVWNEQFRGKHVTSLDGATGDIPADCRLVIGNCFVANDVPVEYMRLAIQYDAYLGYHPYSWWVNGVQASDDWENHAGRWDRMERQHSLKPRWAFTEGGPYADMHGGWKSPRCLNGNVALLLTAFQRFYLKATETLAYREGRAFLKAWFSIGGNENGWPDYDLRQPELSAITDVIRPIWHMPAYNLTAPEPRARGLDTSGFAQYPWEMNYPLLVQETGMCFGFYETWLGNRQAPYSAEHRAGMQAAGMLTGPYVAMSVGGDQALLARRMILSRHPTDRLPYVCDFEVTGLTEADLRAFCNEYDRQGRPPEYLFIYTRPIFWLNTIPSAARARYTKYGFWDAIWPYDVPEGQTIPMDPVSVARRNTPPTWWPIGVDPFSTPDVWQHTSQAFLAGHPGKRLDLDVWNLTKAELFAKYGTPIPGGIEMSLTQQEYAVLKADADSSVILANAAKTAAGTALTAATTVQARVLTLKPQDWWELWPEGVISPARPLAKPNKVMTFYRRDGTLFNPQPLTAVVTWTMWVVERRGDLLNVRDQAGDINDWFVKAQEVQPV